MSKIIKPNLVGLRELRENMDKYIAEVQKGKTFWVLRKSKAVFKMEPPVDEFGDEGPHERLDLRDKNGNGMHIDDVIAMVKKSIADNDGPKSKVSKKVKGKRKSSSKSGSTSH